MEADFFRVVLDAIDEGIHVVDTRGVTIIYNRAAAQLDNLDPSEVIGRAVLEVFPSLTEETSTLLKVLATREPVVDREQTFTTYKGKTVTTINSTLPIFGADGALLGAVEISRDVTRLKDLSERLVSLQARMLRTEERAVATVGGIGASGAAYTFADFIGESQPIRQLREIAARVALRNTPVLVWGETGVGKEVLVQAIHNASPRRDKPFISQNCAALPETLLEGILFGTSRGGFTGAVDRPGLFELAGGGTIFLDEIDSMHPDLQAKLLRVLQDGVVRRVGDTSIRKVDARVVAACGMNPEEAVEAKKLRADLYYRLSVVSLGVPPLRERLEDVPLLTAHFISGANERHGTRVSGVTPEVMALFLSYHWPGNVRELQHAIEGAASLMPEGKRVIGVEDLPPQVARALGAARATRAGRRGDAAARAGFHTAGVPVKEARPGDLGHGVETELRLSLREQLEIIEKMLIEQAMEAEKGNVARAARRLGVPRQTLQYRLRR